MFNNAASPLEHLLSNYVDPEVAYWGVWAERVKEFTAEALLPLKQQKWPFNVCDYYKCRINYAPFFFRDVYNVYMALLGQGYTEDQLSEYIENKARVVRYFSQYVIPGAFVDTAVPVAEKRAFLERFAKSALITLGRKPVMPHYELGQSPDDTRKMNTLINFLLDTCEKVYIGDQTVGYTSFGVVDSGDHTCVVQEFDLNLGESPVTQMGRVATLSVYPRDLVSVKEGRTGWVHIFEHRQPGSTEPVAGRPPMEYLVAADAKIAGQSLSIEQAIRETARAIKSANARFEPMDEAEGSIAYCSTQSRAIKNLMALRGERWQFPSDAEEAIQQGYYLEKFGREFGIDEVYPYADISLELMKRSTAWAKELINY